MKKLITCLFISILVLCGISLAENVEVTNLSSLTSSCTPNETLNMSFYLTNSTNSTTRYPSDTFGNDHDSFIRTDQPGSTIDIWRNGVISNSSCNTWNLVSNVVLASDSDGAQIFKNTDGCVLNIPPYQKTNSTSIDAQIHYSIGYSRIETSGTPRYGKFYYKFNQNTWKCYPAGNSVSNPNNCSSGTINIGQGRRHLGECINYRVYRCGDGLINGYNGSKNYSGGAYTYYEEECDPNAPGWNSTTCNPTTCKVNQQQNPQCNTTYNGQIHYTYFDPTRWLTENTSDLCINGTLLPGSFASTWYNGGSRHFTWSCTNGTQTVSGCQAYQQRCGDGKIETNYGESCDEGPLNGTPGHCNATCTGVPEQPQCNSQYNGQTQYTENSDPWLQSTRNLCTIGSVSGFNYSGTPRIFTWNCVTTGGSSVPCTANQQRCGDGQLNGNEECDYNDQSHAGWNGMQCDTSCHRYIPGSPVPYLLKEQKTGGMANFTTNQINVEIGDIITYKVNFGNSGTVAATGEVRDILPPCVNYLTSSIHLPNGVTYNGPIELPYGSQYIVKYKDFLLQPGKGGYMLVQGQIRGTGTNGTTSCQNVTTYINTGYFKFVGGNTLQSQVIAVRPQTPPTPGTPILTIDKEQLTTGNLTAGDYVAYKITVRNIGSGTATGVTIYDLLPREVQYISSSITVPSYSSYLFTQGTIGGGSLQRTYIRYYDIMLKKNGTATVYLTGQVKTGFTFNPFTNCATVSGSNLQPIEDCETWNPPTPPAAPHLTIQKELLTTGPLSAGSPVAYKITLTNDGNATYYNAYILDIIPSAIQYQTSRIVNISNYLFSEGATGNNEYFIKYYNFNLNPGRSAIVYLTGVLKEGFNFNYTTNCAFTSGDDSCVLLSVGPIPFIQKWQQLGNTTSLHGNWTTGVLTVEPGNFISYKIDFGNLGTSGAYGIVKDILPECVEYITGKLIGATGIGPNYNPATNTVQFSNVYLAAGTTAHMMVVGKIKQDGHCQSVTGYLNTGAFKFNSTDWEYSTVLAIRPEGPGNDMNVTIQKTVDKQYVVPGDIVTYTINYTNHGPDTLTSYTIRDIWPSDKLDYRGVVSMNPVASSEYEGIRDGNIVTWTFNTPLPAYGTGQIVIKGKVR